MKDPARALTKYETLKYESTLARKKLAYWQKKGDPAGIEKAENLLCMAEENVFCFQNPGWMPPKARDLTLHPLPFTQEEARKYRRALDQWCADRMAGKKTCRFNEIC